MRLRVAMIALLLTACATSSKPAYSSLARAPAKPALQYTVRLDDARKRLDVALCFEGAMPPRLVYGTREAVPFLIDPELLLPDGRRSAVAVQGGIMRLPPQAAAGCVSYGVDVQGALDHDALMLAYPGEQSLLLAAELFLWRPQHRSLELQTQLRFVLPPGVHVSTPWRELPGEPSAFALDESAFAFTGHVVLGDFGLHAVPAPGANLRVVTLRGLPAQTEALIAPWIERAARAASLPGGAFPVPNAQVIVVPTSPSAFPIFFGHTGRSGGASIILFLPADIDRERLDADWIAVHEFSHLWHPFVRRQDAWLSEGIATYWQEVLRARLGMISREQVWQRLYEGAELGRQASYSLSEETRRMPFAHNYQIVYWAGAAIALMMDVELRAKSDNKLSLDVLLSRLRKTEPDFYLRARTAQEVLQAFDRLAGMPLCSGLAARYMHGELPDLQQLFQQLGVASVPESATSPMAAAARAPLAWVRDAILASPQTKQADVASVRSARPVPGG